MKKVFVQRLSMFMALNILFEVISPSLSLALTNGPVQPENMGFEPANSSEMVDLFTGDFKYNIPLLDIDGYPLNLAYHAGQSMESEASWVGLGWSLNPGVLNRNMRGLPDDFNGENTTTYTNIKPSANMGVGYQFSAHLGINPNFTNVGLGAQMGFNGALIATYNNYKGYGLEIELDGQNSLSKQWGPMSTSASNGIGVKISSQDGGTLSKNSSYGVGFEAGNNSLNVSANAHMGIGKSINTRTGAVTKSASQGIGVTVGVKGNSFGVGFTVAHTIPAGAVSYAPSLSNNFVGSGISLGYKAGFWGASKLFLYGWPAMNAPVSGGVMAGFKGFYNVNQLVEKDRIVPTFGYLYSENAPEDALMDFNRFRDGNLLEETPNINLTVANYDIFSASAQGLGMAFRPFRSDVGVYHDNVSTIKTTNWPIETELGAGLLLHFLLNISKVTFNGKSKRWVTDLTNNLFFEDRDIKLSANRFYEKYYFKQMGEIAGRDLAFDASMGGEAAVAPVLSKIGQDFKASSTFSGAKKTKREIRNNYIESLTGTQADRYGYEPKINLYEKNQFDLDQSTRQVKNDPNYSLLSRTTKTVITTTNNVNIGHHLSEISMTNPEGSKYVYGIPSYNLYRKKVIFNASDRTESAPQINGYPNPNYSNNPLPISNNYHYVEYDAANGKEILNNRRGQDNFYRHEITNPYASSYLLTSILSPDYVDVTGDGPSYDDLGSYTKFNYYKDLNYGWREPYPFPTSQTGPSEWGTTKGSLTKDNSHANYEKGLVADELDDKGFYEYGIRENYFVHSIETKNMVAFFETSSRYDGMGVSNEHGNSVTGQSQKLDRIKLYSKSEILNKGGLVNAVPLKTIEFEYDYSLCPGTFNSEYNSSDNPDRGKLTLKKVYFSYGSSEKSALSPYKFTYSNNYNYDPRDIDRWGIYKPNSGSATGDSNPASLNNMEFPYTNQDSTQAASYAAAWNLSEIITPSSAKIQVTYESDDYGYVQNEQAGQMLQIENIVSNVDPSANPLSYASSTSIKDADYLIVNLEKLRTGIPVVTYSTPALANAFIKKNLINLDKQLYYKCFIKLAGKENSFGLNKNYYEYVSGYCKPLDVGIFTTGNTFNHNGVTCYKYVYIRVKKEIAFMSKDVNPITIAGWDYLRNFLPRIAYPGSEPANMGDGSHKPLKQFKNIMAGLGVALADFINGVTGSPNKRFYQKNFCNSIVYPKSFIRAYVPFKNKLGGGCRVRKILTYDNWNTMASGETQTIYGQEFLYKTFEGKQPISSGVAMYEPLTGGDEISLRQPIKFEIEKQMAPNDHFYQESPYAEMLYPSPLVGYSKVTVKQIADPVVQPSVSSIGKIEYEFFTAKDFPIYYQSAGLSKAPVESDIIEDFIISPSITKIFHVSQGHLVKMNDMHGKLKAVLVYGGDNETAPISGTRYYYKCSGYERGSKNLITSVLTIDDKNVIAPTAMSRDIDLSVDTRENVNESITIGNSFLLEIGLGINLVFYPAPPYVAAFPWPFVNNCHDEVIYGEQKIGVKTAAMTKVVQQYGILEKVETFDFKSKVTTENLLWDKKTGQVVLTKTSNNLEQPIFSFNYPAYWMYEQMGHEFRRDGIELLCEPVNATTLFDPNSGELKVNAVSNPKLFDFGDEVILMNATTNTKIGDRFWITSDPQNVSANYLLVDQSGRVANAIAPYNLNSSDNYLIKLVRPIDRNNLMSSTGQVISRTNPIAGTKIDFVQQGNAKIIDAFVQEFCSGSSMFIDRAINQQTLTNASPSYSNTPFNSITTGYFGTFRPSKSYRYNIDRTYGTQPDIKNDGVFASFSPFWDAAQGSPWTVNTYSNWEIVNNNKYYSPFGQLLESENSLEIPSSSKYSFNHTLPSASAYNAKAEEIGFDSFEDYTVYSGFAGSTQTFNNDYWGFYGASQQTNGPQITNTSAHTGRHSLYFGTGKTATIKHHLYLTNYSPPIRDGYGNCNISVLDCSKMNLVDSGFTAKKRYLLSVWVKGVNPAVTYANAVSLSVKTTNVLSSGSPIITTVNPPVKASPVINGWQKLDYEISVPVRAGNTHPTAPSTIEFIFAPTSGNSFYMDDIRLHPAKSNMICNVYDPHSLRLSAQLDDRNFATIFEYDQEGTLIRKKKETLNGLYTIQESHKGNIKN